MTLQLRLPDSSFYSYRSPLLRIASSLFAYFSISFDGSKIPGTHQADILGIEFNPSLTHKLQNKHITQSGLPPPMQKCPNTQFDQDQMLETSRKDQRGFSSLYKQTTSKLYYWWLVLEFSVSSRWSYFLSNPFKRLTYSHPYFSGSVTFSHT